MDKLQIAIQAVREELECYDGTDAPVDGTYEDGYKQALADTVENLEALAQSMGGR